jgi:uncharacterized protein YndB with AHSA1/START domain
VEHQVSVEIAAPPDAVYDLVADVTRMGEWSPECVRCRWRNGAQEARPGARFRGTSRNGWHRWSTRSTVVVAERGRELAFDVTYFGLPVATWRYELRPSPAGTSLTERVHDTRGGLLRTVSPLITGSSNRARRNDETMHATVQRLKEVAELG